MRQFLSPPEGPNCLWNWKCLQESHVFWLAKGNSCNKHTSHSCIKDVLKLCVCQSFSIYYNSTLKLTSKTMNYITPVLNESTTNMGHVYIDEGASMAEWTKKKLQYIKTIIFFLVKGLKVVAKCCLNWIFLFFSQRPLLLS